MLHLKWDAPSFSPRGNSLVLPAFQSIELLRDYRRAEQAIAKRWATPFRLIKVGGAFGQKMVMPDQKMLDQVRERVNKMDLKSGLVVPFYVTVETHGTDGQVLNVEDKVKEVKEDIVVALGLSRSLVTGDGPNFATASVSLRRFATGRFPPQPAHPNCRCTSVVAWPLEICGGELGAKASLGPLTAIAAPAERKRPTRSPGSLTPTLLRFEPFGSTAEWIPSRNGGPISSGRSTSTG